MSHAVRVTEAEMVALVKMTRKGGAVTFGWGSGLMYVDSHTRWAIGALREMRTS